MNNYHTLITTSPIAVPDALAFVADPAHGAMDLFVGSVRDHNLGKSVTGVSYEIHTELANKALTKLCNEALKHWGEQQKIYIAHFQGRLDVKGISIIIAVSSPHRDEAFKSCRFLIEEIKHRCPIWKQEHYIDSDSQWVKGHALCAHHD